MTTEYRKRAIVVYEWCIESYFEGTIDVEDVEFYQTLKEMPEIRSGDALVLVRDVVEIDNDISDRQYAYVKDGQLPEIFDYNAKVPQRFHVELEKYLIQ